MTTTDQLEQYVASVYEPDDWCEIRALRNGNAHKHWARAKDLPGLETTLRKANDAKWNLYIGPNPRKDDGLSGDANVAAFRVLFVDFDHIDADGAGPTEIALSRVEDAGLPIPTLVGFSGHGTHCYWRLAETITEQRWRNLQERLNQTLGSDPAIKNPERIMRVPGLKNWKPPEADSFIVQADPALRYRVDEIERPLPVLVAKAQPAIHVRPTSGNGNKTAKARAILYAEKWESCAEGERNTRAYRHACQMLVDFALCEADAWELLSDWNASNSPPLPERELQDAFTSARRHGKGIEGSKLAECRRSVPVTTPPPSPASELEKLIEDEISGRVTNIAWPWPVVTDLAQCLRPGTRTLIVGSIGGSKSLAVLQATSFWVEAGVKVAVLELERSRDFHLNRILAQRAGIADATKPEWVRANAAVVRESFKQHRTYLDRIGAAIHIAPRRFTTTQAAEWIEQRAAEGHRIIAVDPVTALARRGDPWKEDDCFMSCVEKAATQYGASLVFVTHAKKGGANLPDVDSLAGSTAWARFADGILWLQSHDMKLSTVRTSCGTDEQMHNRTLHLLKTRSGEGTGLRLAYRFEVGRNESDHGALTLHELGIIVKSKK